MLKIFHKASRIKHARAGSPEAGRRILDQLIKFRRPRAFPDAGPPKRGHSAGTASSALSVMAEVQAPSGALVITASEPPDISASTVC